MQKEGKLLKDLVNVMKSLLQSLGLCGVFSFFFNFYFILFFPGAAWLSPLQVEASLGTYRILVEKGT